MKKIFSIVVLSILCISLYAQTDVTEFLGIPVDGNKSEMIRKLKAKGFTSSPYDEDILVGEFNGTSVNLHIVTNKNKVYRIMVFDVNHISERDIKIRFNRLCEQFKNNEKYVSSMLSDIYTLADDEDISYEMSVRKKRYQASYYQLPTDVSSDDIYIELLPAILSKYNLEDLSNIPEELTMDIAMDMISLLSEKYSKKSVWFMISDLYGKYYISMF